jgi:hypothetical protein
MESNMKKKLERTDRQKLELFISNVDTLKTTKAASKTYNIVLETYVDFMAGHSITGKLVGQPEEHELIEYLLTLRKFISPSEDVFLYRILNICNQHLTSSEIKSNLMGMKEEYRDIENDNPILFSLNGIRRTPLQITKTYLNGTYFHNDMEYEEQIKLPREIDNFYRLSFLNFVFHSGCAIMIIGNNIEKGLKENLFDFR